MSWSWLGSDDADENDEGNADQNEMVISLVMLYHRQPIKSCMWFSIKTAVEIDICERTTQLQ